MVGRKIAIYDERKRITLKSCQLCSASLTFQQWFIMHQRKVCEPCYMLVEQYASYVRHVSIVNWNPFEDPTVNMKMESLKDELRYAKDSPLKPRAGKRARR